MKMAKTLASFILVFIVVSNLKTAKSDPQSAPPGPSSSGCMTVGGSDKGVACVFPFNFREKSYSRCILEGSKDGVPWCSTLVDDQGVHVGGQGKWGHCGQGCPMDLASTCSCNGFMPKEGVGECKTSYRGKRWCYVTSQSNCADAKQSDNYSGQRWSTEACQTNLRISGNSCTCNGLIYEGKGECKTRYKGRFWCYIGASAACSDRIESTKVHAAWSYQACQQYNNGQEPTPQVLAPTPVPQQDTTEGRQTFELNSDGYIECREYSDCPGEWIDPDCTIIEDDGNQNHHCWQTKYAGSTCRDFTEEIFINGTFFERVGICNLFGSNTVEVTNCYTDPLTNITHKDDCWENVCWNCGDCLVGTNMSTSRYIQVTMENKQKRNKLCEEQGLDNCPENEGCYPGPPYPGPGLAGSFPLTHTSAGTAQESVVVERPDHVCQHEYCKRGDKCCKLVWSGRGYYVCPYRC